MSVNVSSTGANHIMLNRQFSPEGLPALREASADVQRYLPPEQLAELEAFLHRLIESASRPRPPASKSVTPEGRFCPAELAEGHRKAAQGVLNLIERLVRPYPTHSQAMPKYVRKTNADFLSGDGFILGAVKNGVVDWQPTCLGLLLDYGFTSSQIEGMVVDRIYRFDFTFKLVLDR
ncbi:hypothetical protein [Thiorhodococcus fuscus]|uniref:Uncharacterized protein n=1 Tax=Thiorhodococcus fuscus TaxID=527200 RepID=A0ABW4Y8X9_9GAMM